MSELNPDRSQQQLTILIGKEHAEKCVSEMERRIEDDDSDTLKRTFWREILTKYLKQGNPTIAQINEFVDRMPVIYKDAGSEHPIHENFNGLLDSIIEALVTMAGVDDIRKS